MRLSKLIKGIEEGEMIYEGDWDKEIANLYMDSRLPMNNGLFFCLNGTKNDGHLYATEAIRKGAVAVVTEQKLSLNVPQFLVKNTREALSKISANYYGNPADKLKIIGITGTNGKTTTAHILASILKSDGKKVGIIGTLGIFYGEKQRRSTLTTPDPILLPGIFAEMLEEGIGYVVMEVSAHALYYEKVAGIQFDVCIFSNLTQDHLDFFDSMQEYKEAKSRLFQLERCKLAVINGDEETGREFGKDREEEGGKTVYYGLDTPTDAFAVITKEDMNGNECIYNVKDRLFQIQLRMIGRHNVYNALSAVTCAVELGVSEQAILSGITNLPGVEGRLQRVDTHHGAEIFVDFAHTPDGLKQSLNTLKTHCKGRLICLFGCGGNRDRSKRPIMGETVASVCDFAILTSDNPRYEDPLDIISEIEKGYRKGSIRYVVVPERKRAIDYGLDYLKEGDVFLVAGKGGEYYQEIMGIKYPFNDQDIIKKLLEKKGK